MSLSIDSFLRIRMQDVPTAFKAQDKTMAVYVTSTASDQFIDNLYAYFSTQGGVERAFGTDSEIAKATKAAFGSKNPPARLMVAYWNKEGVPIIARQNSVTATQAPVPFVNLASAYQFKIESRNVTESVSYTATEDVKDYDTFVTALNAALGGKTRFVFSYSDGLFALSSKVDGADVDTDNIRISGLIADDLRLSIGRGAKQIRGIAGTTPEKQSIVDLISALDNKQPNFYGFYVAEKLTDQEIIDTHDRLLSSVKDRFFAFTIEADYMLDLAQSNPIYVIAGKNSKTMNAQLNKLGNKHAAVEYMVQACSTNWAAPNTAQTMKFKQQQTVQVDEGITENMAQKCNALGVNFYTDYDGVALLAEGRTVGLDLFFTDSQVGRSALADDLKASIATRLTQLPKIPQTDEGQVVLHNACLPALERFVNNGFGGRNQQWNGQGFGALSTGDNLELGYYIYSDRYATQSQGDREARKAMPTMIAFKESGAIHSAEFIVQVER